jgi:hypothetical protein
MALSLSSLLTLSRLFVPSQLRGRRGLVVNPSHLRRRHLYQRGLYLYLLNHRRDYGPPAPLSWAAGPRMAQDRTIGGVCDVTL